MSLKWEIYSDESFIFKGHDNEADFVGFLQKLIPHRSLTLPFELFWFWLRIRRDIHDRKKSPRLGESATLRLGESGSRRVGFWMFYRKFGERVGESSTPTPQDRESPWWVGESLFEFFKIYHRFSYFIWLNQPFKRTIWQKKEPGM